MFSAGEEECLNGGFFYAFKKDFHAVMHVIFSWHNASILKEHVMYFNM